MPLLFSAIYSMCTARYQWYQDVHMARMITCTTFLDSSLLVTKYLKNITEPENSSLVYRKYLVNYTTDADWAVDSKVLKSTIVFFVLFYGCPVLLFSKKQGCVALSTCEAEYVVLSDGLKEG